MEGRRCRSVLEDFRPYNCRYFWRKSFCAGLLSYEGDT